MRRLRAGLAIALVAASGCSNDGLLLAVDLTTDLVPGLEVHRARVTLEDRAELGRQPPVARTVSELPLGDALASGVRIAELRRLRIGAYRARIELLDRGGRPVVERRVHVRLDDDFVVRVVIARGCVSTICPRSGEPPDRTECVSGTCLSPECIDPAECGVPPLCESAGDCPVPVAGCASARCVEGVCLAVGREGACAAGEACDPDVACVPVVPGDPEDVDRDGDGAIAGVDCDDRSPERHPGATEVCGNGTDESCDGIDEPCPATRDGDGDGAEVGLDCDDANPGRRPGAPEVCGNGLDEDCNGADAQCTGVDADRDGSPVGLDCDDRDPRVRPGAIDTCGDFVDQDCSGGDARCGTAGYGEPCITEDCVDSPDEHLACVGMICQRCCIKCLMRDRFHWVNVDVNCTEEGREWCDDPVALDDEGRLRGGFEAAQWGSCAP